MRRKTADTSLPRGVLTSDLREVTKDPEIKVVAHLVGGLEPARTIMLELLESGKDIVTANKAVLAEHGPELFDRARALGRVDRLRRGGRRRHSDHHEHQPVPCRPTRSSRSAASSTARATSSSRRWKSRAPTTPTAVKEAQRLGYAEADPTMDVDGSDAAQKLAILAHLAFGARVHWNDIPRVGHRHARDRPTCGMPASWAIASSCWPWRSLQGSRLELHVSPTLVKMGTPLAEVRGAYNAMAVVGDAVGRLFFHGLGAGQMPTASAVVADMIDMVVGPHADHVSHAGAVVARRGAGRPTATTRSRRAGFTCGSPSRTGPACWRRSPACWAATAFRSHRSFSTSRARRAAASCRW